MAVPVAVVRWCSLIVFCCQNSITPIAFRFAMTEKSEHDRANTSMTLFVTESLKLVLSFFLLLAEGGCSIPEAVSTIHRDVVQKPGESVQLGVPAAIYAVQNALLQWSASHLSAALWQVTYQGKILVTAFFSVVLLQKKIKRVQWLALVVMGLGIGAVEAANSKEGKQASMGNAKEQNVLRGLLMLLLACLSSGFASVFTEMLFKQVGAAKDHVKKSVWLQNMQLAAFSQVITACAYALEEIVQPTHLPALHGFSPKVMTMAVNNAVGGLLVALVIKYADNILRGFASSFATILCAVMSVFFFDFRLSLSFGVGTVMVLASSLLYGGILKLPGDWWDSELPMQWNALGSEGVSGAGTAEGEEEEEEMLLRVDADESDGEEDEELEVLWVNNQRLQALATDNDDEAAAEECSPSARKVDSSVKRGSVSAAVVGKPQEDLLS